MTPNPPHIGILAADLSDRHGWARYSLNVIRALQAAGARVTVIAARNSPPIADVDVLPMLPTVEPLDRGMLLRQLRVLRAARAALRSCDVIHSLIEPYAPLAAALAGERPLFVTGHGSYVRASVIRRPPARTIYAAAFRRALMICVSRYTAEVVETVIPGARTAVVGNGVDFERFAPLERLPHPHPTVLCVGVVKPRKGTLDLVQAMALVRESIPAVRCRIVGSLETDRPYVAQVRAAIRDLGLDETVELTGGLPNDALLHAYASADVFALPSQNIDWKFEGFGLALLEASAAGLPVIGSRDCGAADAVIDGVTGLLVGQNDPVLLAQALTTLLTQPDTARQMGYTGRAHAQMQTWDAVAEQLLALYAETP